MSFVYEIKPNSAQSTQMKINLAATVLLSALPGDWEDLQLRHTSGFDINLTFQQYMTLKNKPALQRILAWEHFGTCTLVILYDWKMLRNITHAQPAFVCLFEISYTSNPPGLSQWLPIYHCLWQVKMCGLHHMKLRLASIIVTENELMPEIHIPDEKLHEHSFLSLNILTDMHLA